jgi:ferredoxin
VDPERCIGCGLCRERAPENIDSPRSDLTAVVGWMSEQAIVESAGRYLSHGYLGCLGVGMPFGLAAKLAHPEAKVRPRR